MRQGRAPTPVDADDAVVTREQSAGPFDPAREIPGIELALERLGTVLDRTGALDPFGIIALGICRRARSLWLGVRHSAAGPSNATVQVGVRAMVEIVILLPWLALDPVLHTRLWTGESERQILAMTRRAPTHASPRVAEGIARTLSAERVGEMERAVREVRDAALAAHVKGVGRNGGLVPSLETMVEVVDSPVVREAYGVGYNYLSGFVHSGARSLGVSLTPAGVMFDDDVPSGTLGDRAMAAMAYAVILELASEIVGFDTAPAARRIRERMLVWSDPSD